MGGRWDFLHVDEGGGEEEYNRELRSGSSKVSDAQ